MSSIVCRGKACGQWRTDVRHLIAVFTLMVAMPLVGSFAIHAQPAGAQSSDTVCPNQGVRVEQGASLLPDCRAYEMVTPPYKEGFGLFPKSYAANGDGVTLVSLGGLAGALGVSVYPPTISDVYRAQRSPEGWRLSPLNSSNSEFSGQIPEAYEAESGDTLWVQHGPAESASHAQFYVRSPTSQPMYLRIGPDKPTETYEEEPSNAIDANATLRAEAIAATRDFTHVVLRGTRPTARWQFDESVDPSGGGILLTLYEYSGTNNEQPILIGVSGEKGSTQLLSKCGTLLGSGSGLEGSAYNALSRDGETIFFTATQCAPSLPTRAELYARMHGALTSPAPAKTVHISASACTAECGAESGKNFEGASAVQGVEGASKPGAVEEGDRVFFTSTQKLTDDTVDHTTGDATQGACAEVGCNLYEYRLDGAVPVSARLRAISPGGDVLGVVGIAEDGSHVYYVSSAKIAAAGDNVYGKAPEEGQPNLYVYDAVGEHTAFIATLSSADKQDWRRRFERPAQVAGETGRFLLFASQTPGLTPDATSMRTQLYEYKTEGEGEAAELVRVTKGEDGYNEDGNGVRAGVTTEFMVSHTFNVDMLDFKSTANSMNISTDGHTLVFETAGQLSPRAVSAERGAERSCQSVYEFHVPRGVLSEGSVGLVSDGRDALASGGPGSVCGALFQAMDSTGANILFGTADPLLSSDVDGAQVDLYDARVDGGFPLSPRPVACASPAGCEGPVATPRPMQPGSAIEQPETPTPALELVGKHVNRVGRLSLSLRACRKRFRSHDRRVACERNARRRHAGTKTKGKR